MKYFNYITEYNNLVPVLLDKFVNGSGVVTDTTVWKMSPELYEAKLHFIHVIYADAGVTRLRLGFAEFDENMNMVSRVTNISSTGNEIFYQYTPREANAKYVYFFSRPYENLNNTHIDYFTVN